MAGDAKKLQPIIIKRIKKGGHGAHGGAWKIAYADFVTAMMAFFLLMWLLGSTSEGDKKGIADFFSNPVKVSLLGGGTGSGDSSSVVRGGGTDLTRTNGQVKRGDIEAQKRNMNLQALKANQAKAEAERLDALKKTIQKAIDGNKKLAGLSSQLRLDMTRDGLRIQIVDDQNRPMFDSGSSSVKPYMGELLREIGQVLAEVPNKVTLEGHTDSLPFSVGERGYSNWELSSDRANASRRELISGGLPYERVLRVQGLASSVPFDKTQPSAPTNRRISIIVMNRDAEDRFHAGSSDGAAPAEPELPVTGAETPPVSEATPEPVKQAARPHGHDAGSLQEEGQAKVSTAPQAAAQAPAKTAAPAPAPTPLQAAVKEAPPPTPAEVAAQLAANDAAIRNAAPAALATPAPKLAPPRIVSSVK